MRIRKPSRRQTAAAVILDAIALASILVTETAVVVLFAAALDGVPLSEVSAPDGDELNELLFRGMM